MRQGLPSYESLSVPHRKYCVEMMLAELDRKKWEGGTRVHLSLDLHDEAVIRVLLYRELAQITVVELGLV